MNKGKSASDVVVDDPAAAMRKMEDFTRRVLRVPKKEIDAKLSREKTKRGKRR